MAWGLVLGSLSGARAEKVLRLAATEWEPYIGKQLLNFGLIADIADTALRRAGYRVDLKIVPWNRALSGIETGVYDGIIGIWHNSQREQQMIYSQALVTNEVYVFRHKDRPWSYQGMADLTGKKIGVVEGYSYGDLFDHADYFMRSPSKDLHGSLAQLIKGRVDAVVAERKVMTHILNTKDREYQRVIEELAKPLVRRTLHLTLNRLVADHEKIMQDFNFQLEAMREDGLLKFYMQKHNLVF